MDQNESKNMILNMREQFRQDIRRRDQESFFKKKRLQYIQQQLELPEISLEQLIPKIQECIVQKNIMQLGQLHLVAFKFIIENQQNEDHLLKNFYIDLCIQSIKLNQFDCYRTLINLSLNALFTNNQISESLIQISLSLLNQQIQQLEYILLFLANIVSQFKINLLQLLPNLLQLSEKADGFLLTSLVYLLSSIIEYQQLNVNQKQIGVKLVLNALKKEQTEECLMPLLKLYDQTFDQLLLESNCFDILVNHECQMLDKCLAIIKQFTLSDSLLIANKFIDLNILDKLQLYLNQTSINIKKEVYLILANLSYNDLAITTKILNHPIIVKLINNIVTTNEKKYCMSVILNLQATGNELASKKFIDLGLIVIICNLLDIAELNLIQQFLDSIFRILQFQNVKELLKQQNFKLKLDKIYQDNNDHIVQELYTKIIQLL